MEQMIHSWCVVDFIANMGPDKKFLQAIRRINLDAQKKAWIPAATEFVRLTLFMVRPCDHVPVIKIMFM